MAIHQDIQRGRRGLVPVRSAVVQDENGNSCTTTEAQKERWRRHFSKILNIPSDFDVEELSRVRQRPTRMLKTIALLPIRVMCNSHYITTQYHRYIDQ